MAIPVWPESLPQRFLVDGYSEKLRDGRLMTKTSYGPGKTRRRFSSAVLPVAAAMLLDYDAKARFELFWEEDTQGGILPFTIPDQTHDGIPLLDGSGNPVLDGSGELLLVTATWLAMFGQDAPTITPWGLQFSASFVINVMP